MARARLRPGERDPDDPLQDRFFVRRGPAPDGSIVTRGWLYAKDWNEWDIKLQVLNGALVALDPRSPNPQGARMDNNDPLPSDLQVWATMLTRQVLIAASSIGIFKGVASDNTKLIVTAAILALLTHLVSYAKSLKLKWSQPPTEGEKPKSITVGALLWAVISIGALVAGGAMMTGCKMHPTQQANTVEQSATTVLNGLTNARLLGMISDADYETIDHLVDLLDQRMDVMQTTAQAVTEAEKRLADGTGTQEQVDAARANARMGKQMYSEVLDQLIAWQVKAHQKK